MLFGNTDQQHDGRNRDLVFWQSTGHGSGYTFKLNRDTPEALQAVRTPNPQDGSTQVHQTAFVKQVHVRQMWDRTAPISFFGINLQNDHMSSFGWFPELL